MNAKMETKHILIVAAGRSGSKMLRAILNQTPETVIFPREINYLWRHGNAGFPTDELTARHARPEVVAFIREQFGRLSARAGGMRVVEKTCANCLRIPFVHAVFPEAHIVHLIRDGRSVAESARRRWLARPDLFYLLEKARWVPVRDLPYYAWRFARFQLGRLVGKDRSPTSWGPRFAGLERIIENHRLIEICGIQWRECVHAAEEGLAQLPASQRTTVKYEEIVCDPAGATCDLYSRLGLSFDATVESKVRSMVSDEHLEKWHDRLSQEELDLLSPHIGTTLAGQGYAL
jgi:hypothetical protein